MDYRAWIKLNLIPELVKENKIGRPESKIISCEVKTLDKTNNFMVNTLFLVYLVLKSGDEGNEELAFAVKITENPAIRNFSKTALKFYNEVTMYNKLIPELSITDFFPKCYYASLEGENVVILEDLHKKGYRTSDSFILPLDHVELVLKCLGTFHGMFYAMKEKDFEKFLKTVSLFKESFYSKETTEDKKGILYQKMYMKKTLKCVDEKKFDRKLIDFIAKKYEDPSQFYLDLIKPEEPLAVLCHGDFNRNNLLFKYDENGKVKSVKLIDFQTLRYASPATDLSFFLLMNVDSEIRKGNTENFFNIYHESLLKTLKNEVPQIDLKKYSKEAMLKDYRRHVLYGFGICSYFLPGMFQPEKIHIGEIMSGEITADVIQAEIDEMWTEKAEHAIKNMIDDALSEYVLEM